MLGRMRLAGLGLVLLGLLGPGMAVAQQDESLGPRAQNSNITLDVVVEPKNGGPVGGLTQSDFTLLDNKSPQSLLRFAALPAADAPVEAVVVLDTVNIGYTQVAYARDEVVKFLSANGGHLPLPVTLSVVSDTSTSIQPTPTTDGNALAATLKNDVVGLRDLRRSAGFYGAEERLDISLKALQELVAHEGQRPGRKLMIWVSPGWPLLTGPHIEFGNKEAAQLFAQIRGLSQQLREARVTLYSVNPIGAAESTYRSQYYKEYLKGVSKPSQVEPADLSLQVLAVQSGGLALDSSNDVAGLLARCARDASAYYELTFAPAPGESEAYHPVQVKVDKAGLDARTRTGYYTGP